MTKKKGWNAHATHISHSGTLGARQTELDTLRTTSELWTASGKKSVFVQIMSTRMFVVFINQDHPPSRPLTAPGLLSSTLSQPIHGSR